MLMVSHAITVQPIIMEYVVQNHIIQRSLPLVNIFCTLFFTVTLCKDFVFSNIFCKLYYGIGVLSAKAFASYLFLLLFICFRLFYFTISSALLQFLFKFYINFLLFIILSIFPYLGDYKLDYDNAVNSEQLASDGTSVLAISSTSPLPSRSQSFSSPPPPSSSC